MSDLPQNGTAKVLTQDQRDFFDENGWLLLENALSNSWLDRLHNAVDEIVDRSRSLTESTKVFSLMDRHTSSAPAIRDVASPDDLHPTIWQFVSNSILTQIVHDLLGQTIKFRFSALPFRDVDREVDEWHQDSPFDPQVGGHGVLTAVYLHDCGPKNGRLVVIPASHLGEQFTHERQIDDWWKVLSLDELTRLDLSQRVEVMGPAGSIEIVDSRLVHQDFYGSEQHGGPFLWAAYTDADAIPIGEQLYPPFPSTHRGTVLRQKEDEGASSAEQ